MCLLVPRLAIIGILSMRWLVVLWQEGGYNRSGTIWLGQKLIEKLIGLLLMVRGLG